MTTFNLSGVGTTNATTHRGQSDTYNLTHGHTLNLRNNGGADTITTNYGMMGGDSDNFVLTEHGGSTAINLLGSSGPIYGTMALYDGAHVTLNGWSHTRWQNTGNSVINDSVVVASAPIQGGSILVEHGGYLTAALCGAAITLKGGTLIQNGWWGPPGASNVTFGQQTEQHPDMILLNGAVGATSYDIRGDMLMIHDAGGGIVGSATVHNQTGKPLQVDQLANGVAIIADAVARPGMIVGHVVA